MPADADMGHKGGLVNRVGVQSSLFYVVELWNSLCGLTYTVYICHFRAAFVTKQQLLSPNHYIIFFSAG